MNNARRILVADHSPILRNDLQARARDQRLEWQFSYCALNSFDAARLERDSEFDAVVLGSPAGVGAVIAAPENAFPGAVLCFTQPAPKGQTGASQFCFVDRSAPPDAFIQALQRAFRIKKWNDNEALKELLLRMRSLPALPTLYSQIVAELQSPNGSLDFVGRLIATDPVMTGKILQIANSVFFALPRQITNPAEAVLFLGAERVKTLILFAKLFSQFDNSRCPAFSSDQYWRHSMAVAAFASTIARVEGFAANLLEMAFTAGLLHDVGQLLMAANLFQEYDRVLADSRRPNGRIRDVELAAFGVSHGELGACLLASWGLPLPILDAVAWHDCPSEAEDQLLSVLTVVHAAAAIDNERKLQPNASLMDQKYLSLLKLDDRGDRWREACGCAPKHLTDN